MLNNFLTQGVKSEQNLIQDLVDEHIRMHGIEFTYMPRKFTNTKSIMRETNVSDFTMSFPLEGYIENYNGYAADHNLLTKFGVKSTASLDIVISQRRYEEYITPLLASDETGLSKAPTRPLEGDLIYFPLGDTLFEIKYVEHESQFFQLQENYIYVLKCEVFEYGDEKIATGIDAIDDDFETIGYNATLTMTGIGTTATAFTSLVNGGIHKIDVINEGVGYTTTPDIRISPPKHLVGRKASAFGIMTTNSGGTQSLQEIRISDPGFGYTSIPKVFITSSDGEGSGAEAIAGIGTTGSVGIVTISLVGQDYVIPPLVTISDPPAGGVTAIATAVLDGSGSLSAIRLLNAGYGYTATPSVVVSAAGTIGIGTYYFGTNVTGSLSKTSAYVTQWDASTRILKVKDLTGKFTPNEILVGYARATTDTNAYRINTINYDDDTATYDQNVDFQSSGDSILDFTEQNPFGEL